MKTKNLLMLFALAGMIIFASCKKDDDPSPLTYDQATEALTNADNSYNTFYNEYMSSTAASAMSSVQELYPGFDLPTKAPARPSNIKQNLVRSPKANSNKPLGGYGPSLIYFDFPSYVGTWTYNPSTYTWDHVSNSTTEVIIVFSFNGTNDGKLIYSNYLSDTYTDSYTSETITYCTQLKARVEIEGETNPVMSWVYTGSYDESDTKMNENIKYVYTLGSFTQTESYKDSGTLVYPNVTETLSIMFEVKNSGAIVYQTSISAIIKATVGSQTYTLNSITINASFRAMDIIVKFALNITQTNNPSNQDDPSKYMTVSVWRADGAKVADVVFVYNTDTGYYDPYLEFTDGTQEPVSNYFYYLGEQLDSFVGMLMYFYDK